MTTNLPPPSRSAPSIPSRPVRPTKHYPHLQDLIARTEDIHFRQRASIKSWIDVAEQHWTQAQAQRSFGSLDAAYVDYLLSFTIVAQIIPQCNEYSTFKTRASQDAKRYEVLRQILRQNHGVYEAVKEEIKRDNLVSGVLSTEDQLRKVAQDAPKSKPQQKPEVRAKPTHLGGNVVSTSAGTLPRRAAPAPLPANGTTPKDDDLEARFNKLSTKPSSGMTSPPIAPAPTIPEGPTYRRNLNGPREMPPSKTSKLPPLDVSGQLPRMPAPTYSPATSYASPGGLSPRRSSTSRHPLAVVSHRDEIRQPAMEVSGDPTITAELLFKYLQGSSGLSVLLLDVRPREEFNQGTIFGSSVVCIEPVSLREEMSGDNLEETLVLASSHEQDLFAKRHTFNVVVYYDQKTRDTSFMTASTTDERKRALRRLHFAICDYSYSKKLQRLPFLLEGGLDAWIELMGSPALKTFSPEVNKDSFPRRSLALRRTQAQRPPTPALVERSTYRLSQAINSSGPRQDILSYDGAHHSAPVPPINIEEEEQWLAELQRESRPMPNAPPPSTESADLKKRRRAMSIVTQGTDPYPRTVEEFFQRYPSTPHGGDKESMVVPTAIHAEPEPSSPTALTRRNTIIDHPFHGFSDVRNPDFHPPSSPSRPLPVAARKSYSGVSEKHLRPSERGSVPVSSGFTPFKTPLTGASAITVGNTGLKNLGNTCYMNSILQCMSGTTPLCRYFLDGSYKGHINRDNPLGSRGILAEAYATVIRHLWSGEYTFISPVTFKTVSGRLNETFKTNDQQDAQEFLDFLLDGLHEDLNPNANRTKLNPLTDEEERRRELLPLHDASHREWQRYTHQNCSVIVNWLQGQLSSKLRCLTCGTTSTTYNPFMYLSVPIPIRNATFTLDDCLKEFMKEETLDGDDAWNCPKCKEPRKATKKLTITRLPPILIVHLKRFTNRGRWGDKLNTPIDFPIDNLDLTRYFPALPPGTEGATREAETTPPFSYELYGVVNHFGTLHGGHYTAYVKNGMKTWYTFDDSRAVKMDEADVVTRNAYVLFFVRRSVF